MEKDKWITREEFSEAIFKHLGEGHEDSHFAKFVKKAKFLDKIKLSEIPQYLHKYLNLKEETRKESNLESYYTLQEIQEANFSYSFLEGKSCAESLNVLQNIDDKIPLSIIPKELHKYLKQENNMNKEYRPYKEEELPDLVGKVVQNIHNKAIGLIASTHKKFIWLGWNNSEPIDSKELLNNFTFKDGSVCGVKEEKFYSILELDVNKKYVIDEDKEYIYYDNKMKSWFFESKHAILLTDNVINAKFKEYETIR